MRLGAQPMSVPVQAPGALQEQVHRRQVGEHEVKVNIQRLFRYLGRHQQGPLGALPLLAEAVEHLAFQASALVFGKTRMEQQQAGFLADLCLQQAIESLRAVYGVDDNYATAAMGQGLQRLFGDTWEGFRYFAQENPWKRTSLAGLRPDTPPVGQQQTRVGRLR